MGHVNPHPKLTHFALFVKDIDKMEEYYTNVLGLTVTDQGPFPDPSVPVSMVFMSNDPGEHHQFVLVTGRPDDVPFALNQQMSFLVNDLDQLRAIHARAVDVGVENIRSRTHGNAWSIYFKDLEGNQIEVYVHTPWYIPQPHSVELDLNKTNQEIYDWTEEHCRGSDGFMMAEEREALLSQKMGFGP